MIENLLAIYAEQCLSLFGVREQTNYFDFGLWTFLLFFVSIIIVYLCSFILLLVLLILIYDFLTQNIEIQGGAKVTEQSFISNKFRWEDDRVLRFSPFERDDKGASNHKLQIFLTCSLKVFHQASWKPTYYLRSPVSISTKTYEAQKLSFLKVA